ncbi:cytochrome c3 family protein [Deferrisoma camini]|uniref:cytochrome c3 family protein n=1 Tax=Deferrisoma camini TaxID=1035120 RepID=UPI00046C9291|nr:cytochrome c3 family protein [Deferrisoma camini]
MRGRIVMALAASLAFAAGAWAGVTGSKHDMDALGLSPAGVTGRGVCSYCHVPHGAKGDRLWAGAPSSGYGVVANLCGTCHLDSTLMQGRNSGTKMFNQVGLDDNLADTTHMYTESSLDTGRFADGNNLSGSGMDYAGDGGDIECTSCHNPHNNADGERPFLASGNTIFTLCSKCHSGRVNQSLSGSGTGLMWDNSNGDGGSTHPVNIAADSGSADRPVTLPAVLSFVYDDTATNSGSLATAPSWVLGGHVDGSNNISCVTCHVVHGWDPDANQITPTGLADSVPATDALADEVIDTDNAGLLGVTGAVDLCTACHSMNPGGTDPSHPVYTDATYRGSVTGNDLEIDSASWLNNETTGTTSAVYGAGASGNVVGCASCHDTHYGQEGTPILAQTDAANAGMDSGFCQGCHTGTILTNRVHHPADPTSTNANNYDTTSWSNYATATDNMPTAIQCYTCHKAHNAVDQGITLLDGAVDTTGGGSPYDFILRALNWDSANANEPTSGMCVACHSANPASYKFALASDTGLGSHWVSQAASLASPSTDATVDLANMDTTSVPGIQTNGPGTNGVPIRAAEWPTDTGDYAGSNRIESFSKVGGQVFEFANGPASTDGGVLCESCHSVTNPRDEDYLLLGEFDDTMARVQTDRGTADTTSTSDPNDYVAGSSTTAAGGDGLCLGCHGIPVGTHPTTGATVSRTGAALDTDTSAYAVADPGTVAGTKTEAVYQGTDDMTCGACHDVHSGNTGASIYILKDGFNADQMGTASGVGGAVSQYTGWASGSPGTGDPSINFTDLCAACHTQYR